MRKMTLEEQKIVIDEIHKSITPVGRVEEITLEGKNIDKFVLEIYAKGRKDMIEKRFVDHENDGVDEK